MNDYNVHDILFVQNNNNILTETIIDHLKNNFINDDIPQEDPEFYFNLSKRVYVDKECAKNTLLKNKKVKLIKKIDITILSYDHKSQIIGSANNFAPVYEKIYKESFNKLHLKEKQEYICFLHEYGTYINQSFDAPHLYKVSCNGLCGSLAPDKIITKDKIICKSHRCANGDNLNYFVIEKCENKKGYIHPTYITKLKKKK